MATFSHIGPARIEALSDMIFGLALSITAIQLAFAPPNNEVEIVGYIAEFVVSFALLIWIWTSYTRICERITIERENLLVLTIVLLLVVSLEPYLLFIVWSGIFLGRDEGLLNLSSIAWTIDVATMFLLLGLMTRQGILHPEHEIPVEISREVQRLVYWRYVSVVVIGIAALPFFWAWAITTSQLNDASPPTDIVLHARYFYWIVALGITAVGAGLLARRGDRAMERIGIELPSNGDAS